MDELVNRLKSLQVDVKKNPCDERCVQLIKTYAKTVLDVTWIHENKLTQENFVGLQAETESATIIQLLEGVQKLCQEFDESENSVKNFLGLDFAECLLWRKGALMYAISSTKLNDQQWIQDEDNRSKLLSYLIDGIQWFRLMLTQREPCDDTKHDGRNISDSLSLMEHNIYSDNHLLAMMYLSEMCFWYNKYSKLWQLFLHTDFDVKDVAKHYLNIYINAVENILKDAGWNCVKAKQLLELL